MKIKPFMNAALVGAGLSVVLLEPSAARATLGEPAGSITADATQLNATAGAKAVPSMPGPPAPGAPVSANFSVEQLTTPEGVVVSEYVSQRGTVFAVTWRGPTPPDVATLLGTYFKQYRDAADTGAPSPLGVHASSVHASNVTVETAGHMGYMWGRAYLPAAVPTGVSPSEIK
jgi:Protein of unknown function (DUF2844)